MIAVLRYLKKHLRGQEAILIYEGFPACNSWNTKQHLASQRSWLQAETLPVHSPDLNLVEDSWSNIKSQELANHFVAENNRERIYAVICKVLKDK